MKLVFLQGPDTSQKEVFLANGQNVAGRDPANEIHLPSRRVSRKHCVFEVSNGHAVVRDLGSSNGVIVEGHRIQQAALANGQRIQIGDYLLQYHHEDSNDAPELELEPDLSGSGGFGFAPSQSGFDPAAPAEPSPLDLSPKNDSAPAQPETPFGGFGASESGAFGGSIGGEDSPFGAPAAENQNPFGSPPAEVQDDPFGGASEQAKQSPFGQATETAAGPESPFGDLPPADSGGQGGFGGGGFGGGYQDGFNPSPAQQAPQPEAASPASGKQGEQSAAERVLREFQQSLTRIPWTSRFAALLTGCLLLVMLIPGGGILSMLSKAESSMERMSAAHALEVARISARINEPLIVTADAYALDRANVSALDRMPGVSPGGARIVDNRGNIKLPKDQVGTTIEGINKLINQAMASRKTEYTQDGGKLSILSPIRYESETSGPAQVVGGLYVEYELSEFVNDTGRPSSLALVAFVVLGLIFIAIFMVTWRMTNLPVRHVQEETELAMKGSLPEVTSVGHWPEMETLVHSINRVLRRAGAGGVDFDRQLGTLVEMSPWPIILTDGQLRVTHSNPVSSKILSAAPEACIGQPLPRLIRDPQIANTMKALVAKVGGGQGNQGSDTIVIDGRNRTLSIRVETSAATGAVEYAVVLIT